MVITGSSFVINAFFSKRLRRDLLPIGDDWRSIGKTFLDHLRFRHPSGEAARNYNILQKLAYLSVIFLLRLRLERQLGYKMAKYVIRIELVDDFSGIAGAKGGYWEDQGYEWYAGI